MFKFVLQLQLLHILTLNYGGPAIGKRSSTFSTTLRSHHTNFTELHLQLPASEQQPQHPLCITKKGKVTQQQYEQDCADKGNTSIIASTTSDSTKNSLQTLKFQETTHLQYTDSHDTRDTTTAPADKRKLGREKKTRLHKRSVQEGHFRERQHENGDHNLREIFPTPLSSLGPSTRKSGDRKKLTTQKFKLRVQKGQTILYHEKQMIVNLTSPKMVHLTKSDMVVYEKGRVSIILGTAEATHHTHIKTLVVYGEKEVYILTSKSRTAFLTDVTGDIFVDEKRAFYSLNQQFTALLNSELARMASANQSRVRVKFQTTIDQQSILSVNGVSIIMLTGTQFRTIILDQFLTYKDSTLHYGQASRELFLEIDQLYLVIPPATAGKGFIQKYVGTMDDVVLGGGDLYVHKATRTALFSREDSVNAEIQRHLTHPPTSDIMSFSIKFETYIDNLMLVQVVLQIDGDEILTLNPADTTLHSVAPQHHLTYTNSTMVVSDGLNIFETTKDICLLTLYTNGKLTSHSFSLPQSILGGGQLFACKGLGLYSDDSNLNDRIGDALIAAATQNACH